MIVRRIGMTKPPVKLGVGKKFLEKRKEPPSGKMRVIGQKVLLLMPMELVKY